MNYGKYKQLSQELKDEYQFLELEESKRPQAKTYIYPMLLLYIFTIISMSLILASKQYPELQKNALILYGSTMEIQKVSFYLIIISLIGDIFFIFQALYTNLKFNRKVKKYLKEKEEK